MARSKTTTKAAAKAKPAAKAKAAAKAQPAVKARPGGEAKLKGSVGVRVIGAKASKAPPFKPEIDAALLRLAEVAGVARPEMEKLLARASYAGVGPWTYLSNAIKATQKTLWQGPLIERAAQSWLGHLISGESKEYTGKLYAALPPPADFGGNLNVPLVKASKYTGEARTIVRQDFIFGGRGADLFCLWRINDDTARIVRVRAPGEVEILGETVLDFVRRQLAELGLAEAPAAVPAAKAALPGVWVMSAAPAAPRPTDIARLGGLPIGITSKSWPRRGKRPMHHVLTIDLHQHPSCQPPGYRALALFVSSPDAHEAFAADNDHTAVVLLTEADLARGEPQWPTGLRGERLEARALTLKSGDALSDGELFRGSFMGGSPEWLQDAEHSGLFVLQFDGKLVPMNLGDQGVMYVFADTAFMQSN